MNKLVRMMLLPLGLLTRLYELAVSGSRDLSNKTRFREAIIDRGCCIDEASRLDANCHILENSRILGSTMRRFSYVGRNSLVQNARIGAFCSIANDVIIGLGAHPAEHFSTSPLFYRVNNTFRMSLIGKDTKFEEYQPIDIGNDVWIGARAVIMDGVKVGDGAIIAANAVVTRDVPPYAIVGGVPAKLIRYRFSEEKIDKLLESMWWDWPLDQIKQRMNGLNA